jgi:hypothetical protein
MPLEWNLDATDNYHIKEMDVEVGSWITCGTCFKMMDNLSNRQRNAKYSWHVKSKDPFGVGRWNEHKKQSAHLKMCQRRAGDEIATNHTMTSFFVARPKNRSARQYLLEPTHELVPAKKQKLSCSCNGIFSEIDLKNEDIQLGLKYSLEYYAHDEANKKYAIGGFVKDEDGKDTDVLSMFSLICEPSKHA